MANSENPEVREIATKNVRAGAVLRTMRSLMGPPSPARMALFGGPKVPKGPSRYIYNMQNAEPDPFNLPGKLVRSEGEERTGDLAVDEAYDYSGATYGFYNEVFGRDSLDDAGMALISSVHCGVDFDNAFWNGQQMAYGDGDNQVFTRFTKSLDVIGHELTHGVVSHECDLIYQGQSGALNEHFADVFGSMVRQYFSGKQTVDKADWLIGPDIIVPASTRQAIRSMKAPGTAFQGDPFLGDDPQPAHRDQYDPTPFDNGGVHINSGIPNHAFYLAATQVDDYAWGPVGQVWYAAMRALSSTAQFCDMADTTRSIARAKTSKEIFQAIDSAWTQVGL